MVLALIELKPGYNAIWTVLHKKLQRSGECNLHASLCKLIRFTQYIGIGKSEQKPPKLHAKFGTKLERATEYIAMKL